jgi:hypothetical protein
MWSDRDPDFRTNFAVRVRLPGDVFRSVQGHDHGVYAWQSGETVLRIDHSLKRVKEKVAALRRYLAFDGDVSMEDMFKQLDTFVEVRRVDGHRTE